MVGGPLEGLGEGLVTARALLSGRSRRAGGFETPLRPGVKRSAVVLAGGSDALLGGRRHAHICRPELLALCWVSPVFGVKPTFETRGGTPREQRGDRDLEQQMLGSFSEERAVGLVVCTLPTHLPVGEGG